VLSDHADWPGLLRAIEATGASRVIVTHGDEAVLVRWLRERGWDAGSFKTDYGHEGGEIEVPSQPEISGELVSGESAA
jgi:putative mRNA 3-end processing factor